MSESDGAAPLTDQDFAAQLEVAKAAQDEARKRLAAESPPSPAPDSLAASLAKNLEGRPLFDSDLRREVYEQERLAREKREQRETLAAMLRTIPAGYRMFRFGAGDWVGRRPWSSYGLLIGRCYRLAEREGTPSAAWMGGSGRGKTSLAVATLALWAEHHIGQTMMFVSSYKLAVARMHHPVGEGDPPLVVDAMTCSLLLLDDLGSEPHHVQQSAVADVLHERHEQGRPTWVTTWCTEAEPLANRYGEGIARRVFDRAELFELSETGGKGAAPQ